MTDEEIICTWMESRPADTLPDTVRGTKWWRLSLRGYEAFWIPKYLGLDAIHEVEARLTGKLKQDYEDFEWDRGMAIGDSYDWARIHADAPTRIKALAEVLRLEVEK